MELRETRRYAEWFARLRDRRAKARIDARLRRFSVGNPGDVKSVGGGVQELRIDYGPGYRVYFGKDVAHVVILLGGGTKKRQNRDIWTAQGLWTTYKARKQQER